MLFTILIKIIDNILYQKSMRNSVTICNIDTKYSSRYRRQKKIEASLSTKGCIAVDIWKYARN